MGGEADDRSARALVPAKNSRVEAKRGSERFMRVGPFLSVVLTTLTNLTEAISDVRSRGRSRMTNETYRTVWHLLFRGGNTWGPGPAAPISQGVVYGHRRLAVKKRW